MKKSISKEGQKRGWKTGSPPHIYELRSPRFNRNVKGPKNGIQQKQKFDKLTISQRNKEAINLFKNQLRVLKLEANRMLSSQQSRSRAGSKYNNDHEQHKLGEGPETPMEQYYMKRSTFNLKKPLNIKKSRHNSFQDLPASSQNQRDKLLQKTQSTKRFHQTIRKFTNQNEKLRKQNEELRHQIQQISVKKQQLFMQYQKLKTSKMHQKTQNSVLLIQALHEQINDLKKQLQYANWEIKETNHQSYQIKKQLFDLKSQKSQLQEEVQRLKGNTQQKQKLFLPRLHQKKEFKLQKKCITCKKNTKNMQQLVYNLQNKVFESTKKQKIIDALCKQIQKLQQKINALDRPKNMFKKYDNLINELNENLMETKLGKLNKKYEFMYEEGQRKRIESRQRYSSTKKK